MTNNKASLNTEYLEQKYSDFDVFCTHFDSYKVRISLFNLVLTLVLSYIYASLIDQMYFMFIVVVYLILINLTKMGCCIVLLALPFLTFVRGRPALPIWMWFTFITGGIISSVIYSAYTKVKFDNLNYNEFYYFFSKYADKDIFSDITLESNSIEFIYKYDNSFYPAYITLEKNEFVYLTSSSVSEKVKNKIENDIESNLFKYIKYYSSKNQ